MHNPTDVLPTWRPAPCGAPVRCGVPLLDTAAELRGRINLALSILSHRGYSLATAILAEQALRGESIAHLAAGETHPEGPSGRRTTEGA
ncbi:MAG TPA: hypothetical protein VGD67_26830 [Pseudonocardiaceae bacterium]